MNRITKKEKNGFYGLKNGNEIYGDENGIRLVQIVGEHEDIEEEWGVRLPIIVKALKEGAYTDEGFAKRVDLTFNHQKEWVISFWVKDHFCVVRYVKDYGKTWALTKEELL